MNAIAKFRKCTLSNDELLKAVDTGFDEIYKSGQIPSRHIPARPDKDLDLLVGEMILRFQELKEENERLKEALSDIRFATYDRDTDDAVLYKIGEILTENGFPYNTED